MKKITFHFDCKAEILTQIHHLTVARGLAGTSIIKKQFGKLRKLPLYIEQLKNYPVEIVEVPGGYRTPDGYALYKERKILRLRPLQTK